MTDSLNKFRYCYTFEFLKIIVSKSERQKAELIHNNICDRIACYYNFGFRLTIRNIIYTLHKSYKKIFI